MLLLGSSSMVDVTTAGYRQQDDAANIPTLQVV